MTRGLADARRELAVRDRLAVRDLEQAGPDPALELGALEPERDVELGAAHPRSTRRADRRRRRTRCRPRTHASVAGRRVRLVLHPERGDRVAVVVARDVMKPTGLVMVRYRIVVMGSGCHGAVRPVWRESDTWSDP